MDDWIGRLLAWLEPWLAYWLELMVGGPLLVAAGTYVGTLPSLKRFARYRVAINRLLALLLLLAAAYFAWRAFGSLTG